MGSKTAISSIRNKQKRQEVFAQVQAEKKQQKRSARIRRKKLEEENPQLKEVPPSPFFFAILSKELIRRCLGTVKGQCTENDRKYPGSG